MATKNGTKKLTEMRAEAKAIEAFADKNGGQEKAAEIIGVDFSTINRWINLKSKPKGLALKRLRELKVVA
jgi:transposase